MADNETVYRSIPGGPELLEWFGHAPSFHDAEIVSLELNRRAPSKLVVLGWNRLNYADDEGYFASDKHAIVTFKMTGISDLQLDGFSRQNVIYGLRITKSGKDPERKSYYDFCATDGDFELVLEPCYGMDGRIRCNSLEIEFVPGKPQDKQCLTQ